jgi:multimeric flavodoxin WrbA
MKVIAFNGSPNMDKGTTALILNPFLKGMKDAGAAVELLYTYKMKINPCRGEGNCMFKNPGRCFQQDDMNALYPKLDADVIVFATPLYWFGPSGSMKNLMDRTIPIGLPLLELRHGRSVHPLREDKRVKGGKLVLVSSCGFWEMDNFAALVMQMRILSQHLDREFAAPLLRPHGANLRMMLNAGTSANDVLEAAEEAGRQLVREGKISDTAVKTIGRELLTLEAYIQTTNEIMKQMLGKTAGDNAGQAG